MELIAEQPFSCGCVYVFRTHDGYSVEVCEYFRPNTYQPPEARGPYEDEGDRSQLWRVEVSVMSGCPVRCRFCATGSPRWRNLTVDEVLEQVEFVVARNPDYPPTGSLEFLVAYQRMGEPFLNLEVVQESIRRIEARYPGTKHYVSTIGLRGSDFSWIEGDVTLQLSLHSFDEARRDFLIPVSNKMTIEELGQIRTRSSRKTTLNIALADMRDFDLDKLQRYFDKEHFFVKLTQINENPVSQQHGLGAGVFQQQFGNQKGAP